MLSLSISHYELVVLNEINADKVLVTAIARLDGVDLRNGRSAYRLQLDAICRNRWLIIDKLFPARWAVCGCAANHRPLVNTIAPDMHFVRTCDDRPPI